MIDTPPWEGAPTPEFLAQRMYTERCVPQGPPWEQLGDVTRGVWLEKAATELYGDLA